MVSCHAGGRAAARVSGKPGKAAPKGAAVSLPGIDVSAIGQGMVFNWDAYRGRIAWAMAKATQGTDFRDPAYPRNRADAEAEGLVFGSYHYLVPEVDGAAQAHWFLSYAQPRPGELVAVDSEVDRDPAGNVLPPAVVAKVAVAFADTIRAQTGAWPFAYGDISMVKGGYFAGMGQCPLWLANPSAIQLAPPIGPWNLISAEQTGQRGVDTDVFYGDLAQLRKLAVLHVPTPPPPPLTSWRLSWPSPATIPALFRQTSTDGGHTWH